jgi:hypothetical protein
MTRAEEYRHLAKQVRARAFEEESPSVRAGWDNLAKCYIRLAEQTDGNDQFDATSDPIMNILGGSRH